MKRIFFLFFFFPLTLFAQTEIVKPDLHSDTKIAPAYFGPNAFPVPDMLDDAVSPNLEVTAAGDYYKGCYGDRAGDFFAKIRIPLFTSRANLVVWVPAIEGYHLTESWKEHANIADRKENNGREFGSAFVSTDILLMRENHKRPALSLRAAMKTASEDSWMMARYYDCPGYFFDAAVGKEFVPRRCRENGNNSYFKSIRVGISGGFLCWQTDNGRQNDATMYAVQIKGRFRDFDISEDLRGYAGWEHDGDCPMVLKTQIQGHFGLFHPYFIYQKGLHDYPYQQFSLGLSLSFDILRKQQKAKK